MYGTGLTLFSQGNITLTNVEVTNSGSGAELTANGNVKVENSKFNKNKKAGAVIDAGGNVDISNSEFNENGSGAIDDPVGFGLDVKSGGAVTLSGVAANLNQKFGATIEAPGTVKVTQSFFNGNISYAFLCTGWEYYGYGLKVVTNGSILLEDVTANENLLFGANLTGTNVDIADSFFNKNSSI